MIWFFYIAAAVAIFATVMVITRLNAVHALLYLIVSLLAVAVIFFLLGAPFIAALEVIVYAGAIMVLFVFVVMMLNLGQEGVRQEKKWLQPKMWIGPGVLALILIVEFALIFGHTGMRASGGHTMVDPAEVGTALFSKYLLGVELSAFLLMAGLIGAWHLGRKKKESIHRFLKEEQ